MWLAQNRGRRNVHFSVNYSITIFKKQAVKYRLTIQQRPQPYKYPFFFSNERWRIGAINAATNHYLIHNIKNITNLLWRLIFVQWDIWWAFNLTPFTKTVLIFLAPCLKFTKMIVFVHSENGFVFFQASSNFGHKTSPCLITVAHFFASLSFFA